MRWRSSSAVIGLSTLLHIAGSQDPEIEVFLTKGTSGLGVQLISETRGKGAVVESVVPGSAASLVLQPGDVCVSIAGIEVRRWTLENIARLLQTQSGRVKIGIQRRLAADSESQLYDDVLMGPGSVDTASCYARLEGDDEMHPIVCTLANFGAGLPIFSPNENLALPVAIAQPLEYCTRREGFNVTGHALLVTRGGCLPHVKALNAGRSGASVLFVVDGQFPPYPPVPKIVGEGFLTPLSSTHPSAQEVEIPLLVIHNDTGARIFEEMRQGGRSVMIASHAGGPPSRLNVKPRNQLPLADVSRLNPRSDAFDLTSVFRDGDMHISFGKPGRPGGDVGNVYLQVTYGLSTILAGLRQTISYTREIICPACHGRGAHEADMRPCRSCSSLGEPGIASCGHAHSHEVKQTMRTTCTRCHGFGEVPKKGSTCPRCNGARVIRERASVEIDIPAGAPDAYTMKFPGLGSQFPGKSTGSVEVVARVEPDERFTRYGADLRANLNITLAEALAGFTRDFQLLNGGTVLLNRTRVAMWQKLQEGIRELHGLPSSICSDARFQNRSKAMKYCLNLCLQDDNFQEI